MKCPECDGSGEVVEEYARRQGFSRDIGYIDTRIITCEDCDGSGETYDPDAGPLINAVQLEFPFTGNKWYS